MIVVPQRLFTDPAVTTLCRDGNRCLLRKRLTRGQREREAYVATHVISLVLSGRQVIRTYGGEVASARAGEALLLPRGIYYIADLLPAGGKAFTSLLLYFDDEAVRRFLEGVSVKAADRNTGPALLHFPAAPVLAGFSEGILRLATERALTRALLGLKTRELLHLLHGRSPRGAVARFLFRLTLPRRRGLRQFMEANYHKPLGVEDYAYLTGRSVSSFRRDFRAVYGTTPNKWLRGQRLRRAVALVEAGETRVADLSYAVGYENVSYFIRAFRGLTGQSPKQFMLARSGTPPDA